MTPPPPLPVEQIGYAPREPRLGPRVWAGAAVLAGGLGVVVLGGCFLIGVLCVIFDVPSPNTTPVHVHQGYRDFLMVVLYALAFICFGAGAWLIVMAVRGLLATTRGR